MSTDHVDALMKSAEADSLLADRLRNAGSLANLVTIGAELGFSFTKEEVQAYLRAVPPLELSEGELESVAGGTKAVKSPPKKEEYLKIELKDVYVTSYQSGG